jgi:hypothetical protein
LIVDAAYLPSLLSPPRDFFRPAPPRQATGSSTLGKRVKYFKLQLFPPA